jgi:hypothetical protein
MKNTSSTETKLKRKDLKYQMLEVKNQEKLVKSHLLLIMMKSKMPKAI